MKVIGIDPGTNCGWALIENGRRVASGVWDLKPRRHEGGGMRYLRARSRLREVLDAAGGKVDAVAYEEVRRHMGVDAAHVYGGIVAMIGAELEERAIPYRGVPVGTVKKLATGKGNADKDAMCAAFKTLIGHEPEDDNEADALFVGLALVDELAAGSVATAST